MYKRVYQSYSIFFNLGGMLKQPKKTQVITDDMISKSSDGIAVQVDDNDSQVRRRHKNKALKTTDRTVLIGSTESCDQGGKISEYSNNVLNINSVDSDSKPAQYLNGD